MRRRSGRSHVHGEPHEELLVGRVASEGEVVHHEVVGHEELNRFRVFGGEAQEPRVLQGQAGSHLAVVVGVSLAQVVKQDCQVEHMLSVDFPIGQSQCSLVPLHFRRDVDGAEAMLVDRVLVVLVELEQAPGVSVGRNEPFEKSHLVQEPQQVSQPRGIGDEREEVLHCLRGEFVGQVAALRRTISQVSGSICLS